MNDIIQFANFFSKSVGDSDDGAAALIGVNDTSRQSSLLSSHHRRFLLAAGFLVPLGDACSCLADPRQCAPQNESNSSASLRPRRDVQDTSHLGFGSSRQILKSPNSQVVKLSSRQGLKLSISMRVKLSNSNTQANHAPAKGSTFSGFFPCSLLSAELCAVSLLPGTNRLSPPVLPNERNSQTRYMHLSNDERRSAGHWSTFSGGRACALTSGEALREREGEALWMLLAVLGAKERGWGRGRSRPSENTVSTGIGRYRLVLYSLENEKLRQFETARYLLIPELVKMGLLADVSRAVSGCCPCQRPASPHPDHSSAHRRVPPENVVQCPVPRLSSFEKCNVVSGGGAQVRCVYMGQELGASWTVRVEVLGVRLRHMASIVVFCPVEAMSRPIMCDSVKQDITSGVVQREQSTATHRTRLNPKSAQYGRRGEEEHIPVGDLDIMNTLRTTLK
ncbi:hypothetical protein B0H17DRAFT_1132992 [Mycena rosella]|uniref:Uncharacterized protein n=1 Tax=Mycena rosella TaxID=1033263 RepID=A0AAD7DM38_MYCRO|nr:hypothetical protein B0H17DRAFT_1132992 [Mycena rosella]